MTRSRHWGLLPQSGHRSVLEQRKRDPATGRLVAHFQSARNRSGHSTIGYKAPVKPRASTIPNSLQVITRKGTLVLEAPGNASEYLESHELRISAPVVARGNALCACIDQCRYAEENLAFISRIAPKQVLRIRWPTGAMDSGLNVALCDGGQPRLVIRE
jgi:hypothetical protein